MDESYRHSLHLLWGAATSLPNYRKTKWFDLERCLWETPAAGVDRQLNDLHMDFPQLHSEPYRSAWKVLAGRLGTRLREPAELI